MKQPKQGTGIESHFAQPANNYVNKLFKKKHNNSQFYNEMCVILNQLKKK